MNEDNNNNSFEISTPNTSSSKQNITFETPKTQQIVNYEDEICNYHYTFSAVELEGRIMFFKDLLKCTVLPNNGENVKKSIQSMEFVLEFKVKFDDDDDDEPVQKKSRKSAQ